MGRGCRCCCGNGCGHGCCCHACCCDGLRGRQRRCSTHNPVDGHGLGAVSCLRAHMKRWMRAHMHVWEGACQAKGNGQPGRNTPGVLARHPASIAPMRRVGRGGTHLLAAFPLPAAVLTAVVAAVLPAAAVLLAAVVGAVAGPALQRLHLGRCRGRCHLQIVHAGQLIRRVLRVRRRVRPHGCRVGTHTRPCSQAVERATRKVPGVDVSGAARSAPGQLQLHAGMRGSHLQTRMRGGRPPPPEPQGPDRSC